MTFRSNFDPDRAERWLRFLVRGIEQRDCAPAGENTCATCTRADDPTPPRVLFLHSTSFGMQFGRVC